MFKPRSFPIIILCLLFSLTAQKSFAGPPFNTDDPEPVPLHHWEYYLATINNFEHRTWSGTFPHFEMNYGIFPNMQVHLLVPLNYSAAANSSATFGYADTELGVKYRFLQETDSHPQVGTFPIFEVPTVKNKNFSNALLKVFIPVWAQKSWGNLTSYGGAGYWFNPGTGNKNYMFAGWELQYDLSSMLTLGGELYYQSPDTSDSKFVTAFNLGGSFNANEHIHIIFSAGHSLVNESMFTSYLALYITI